MGLLEPRGWWVVVSNHQGWMNVFNSREAVDCMKYQALRKYLEITARPN